MLKKMSETWIDTETNIIAEITPETITVQPSKKHSLNNYGEQGFVFKNSKREQANKVMDVLSSFLKIKAIREEWNSQELLNNPSTVSL